MHRYVLLCGTWKLCRVSSWEEWRSICGFCIMLKEKGYAKIKIYFLRVYWAVSLKMPRWKKCRSQSDVMVDWHTPLRTVNLHYWEGGCCLKANTWCTPWSISSTNSVPVRWAVSLNLSGFSRVCAWPGEEGGKWEDSQEKNLPIHGEYKYLFLCLFISALEVKYVQSQNAFCLFQSKRCVTKSHCRGIQNLCLFYSS